MRKIPGRSLRGLLVLLAFAALLSLALTSGAGAQESDDATRTKVVQIIVDDRTDIDALIAADVDLAEYVRENEDGTITLNAVVTEDEEQALRDAGYTIGNTVEDYAHFLAVAAEREALLTAEARSHEAAETGIPAGGNMQASGLRSSAFANAAPELIVHRANYFQNYAGWFLYVEVFDTAVSATGGSGPTVSVAWKTAAGSYGPATTVPRFVDGDPSPDVYMYNRLLMRIGPASPPYGTGPAPTPPATIRVSTSTAGQPTVEAPVSLLLGNPLGATGPNFNTQYFTAYMNADQTKARIESLAAEFGGPGGIAELITMPETTNGYQRKSMCVMSGTGACDTTSNTSSAVYLEATKYGHLGGNDIRAQFRNPGAANSPLTVSVVPNAAGQADIIVDLGTSATGALNSTAAQVVAAINANPQAAAYVTAFPYGGQTGTGTVAARALINLSDFLTAPTTGVNAVQRGPFTMKVLRIGADVGKAPADSHHTGVFIFCEQHAREWVTGISCIQIAELLLRNYATDPRTKELVDNLDIFILPGTNPDGINYSVSGSGGAGQFNNQRKNLTRYCAITTSSAMPSSRNSWGVDINRNSGEYSLFDGYFGASTSCTSETYAGPGEYSEPETRNQSWLVDTYSNIKFANNVHTYGGYFMWAPGSYTGNNRVSAPAPNIGIEGYFFAAADTVLQRIKDVRGTVVLPERTGPIADVLYSAAGNGADEMWYGNQIIAYSFEAGSDRLSSTSTTTLSVASAAGATGIRVASTTGLVAGAPISIDGGANAESSTIASIVTPNPASPNPNVLLTTPLTLAHASGVQVTASGTAGLGMSEVGFQPSFSTEGRFEALEFAAGNFGLLESALAYQNDHTAPVVTTTPAGPAASQTPLDVTFKWVNEPSIIHYTLDGSTPTMSSPVWERQRARGPGVIFTLNHTTTVKWFATDVSGNTSEIESARFAIDSTAPTTSASLAPAGMNGYYKNPTLTLVADDAFDEGGSGVALTEYNLDGGGYQTYSGPVAIGGNGPHTVLYRSTDLAGNVESEKTLNFSIDNVAPETTISLAPPVGGGGFYLSNPTATLSATDAGGSGLAVTEYSLDGGDWTVYTAPFEVSGDYEHVIEYRSVDNAGNVETTHTKLVSIDSVKPTTEISLAPPEQNGYYRNPTVTLTADDNASGVASTEYKLDGSSTWTTYSAPFQITGDGTRQIEWRSTDVAGNVEDTHSMTIVVDGTAPTTTIQVDCTSNAPTWCSGPATVTLTADDGSGDGHSGVASTEYRINGGSFQAYTAPFTITPDGTYNVEYRSTDTAGNVETLHSQLVKIDSVAPTTTASVSGSTSLGWITSNPTVTLNATDPAPASGIQKIERNLDGAGWVTYTTGFVVTGDGSHTVEFRATDNAGNVEATKSVSFKIDTQIPVTTATLSPPPVGGIYRTAQVTLTVNDFGGSGAAGIQYTLDGGGTTSYSGPFWVTGDGSHTITYRAVDLIGRIEVFKTLTFTIDGSPPMSSASLSPMAVGGYYSNPTVTISANDFVGGSGVAEITYLLDSGSWTTYTGPFPVTGDGPHTLQYHATDNVGNVEAVKTKTFNVDGNGPTIAITTPAVGAVYNLNQSVSPSFSCSDPFSGVASCNGPASISTSTIGTKSFVVTATDNAGNTSTMTRTYKVIWPFTGFSAPLNVAQPMIAGGTNIAIKFSLGGNRGTAILAAGSPGSGTVDCTTPVEPASPGTEAGEAFSSPTYSTSTGLYTINWTTKAAWAGTCRMVVVKLADGTTHTAVVKFT